jgi:hypothetical protein
MAYGRKVGKSTANDSLRGVRENSVINAVDVYLTLKCIPHYRINSGALVTPRGQLIRFGSKGMSDFYAIGPAGISIWIECKRPKGGRLSADQKEFLDCINKHSGIGIVVRSVEELESQLKDAGIIE